MRSSILCVMALLLAGCAGFRPKPLFPEQTVAAFEARTLSDLELKTFLEKNLRHEVTPWPPERWDLAMLTLAAFYYQPDLDVARAEWGVAEAGVITAGQRPNPSFDFIPGFNADAAGGISPWTLGLSLDIPIETAGKRGYRISRARHLSDAARLRIAGVAWQVRSRLRERLLDLYAANQTIILLDREGAIQADAVRLLEERLAVGEVSRPDVTQARLFLNQIGLSLNKAKQQRAEASILVANALGLPSGGLERVFLSFDLFGQTPLIDDLPLQGLRRQALLNRPDLLRTLLEYAAAQSALQLEVARQFPDIHLGPGYTWDQGGNRWSLGFSVSLPALNRNQGPIAEAEARRTEAAARFQALQAGIMGEIDRAQAGYRASLEGLETADALLEAQRKQAESIEERFNMGETDRLDQISAQVELAAAARSRLDALVRAHQSFGLLEDAVQRPLDPSKLFPAPEKNPRTRENEK